MLITGLTAIHRVPQSTAGMKFGTRSDWFEFKGNLSLDPTTGYSGLRTFKKVATPRHSGDPVKYLWVSVVPSETDPTQVCITRREMNPDWKTCNQEHVFVGKPGEFVQDATKTQASISFKPQDIPAMCQALLNTALKPISAGKTGPTKRGRREPSRTRRPRSKP